MPLTRGKQPFDSSGSLLLADLKARAAGTTPGELAYLSGYDLVADGAEGTFAWDDSNLITEVTADTRFTVFVPPSSDLTGASGAWVRQYAGYLTIEMAGGSGNGTDDNLNAIIGLRSLIASQGGVVKLLEGKTYYVSGTKIDISGIPFFAEEGATLKFSPEIELTDNIDLRNKVNIINNAAQQYGFDQEVDSIYTDKHAEGARQAYRESFLDWADYGKITGRFSVAAFAGTDTSESITFDDPLTDQVGAYLHAYSGLDAEINIVHDGTGSEGGYLSIEAVGDVNRYICRIFQDSLTFTVSDQNSVNIYKTGSLKSLEYGFASGGQTLLGVRVVDETVVEFYCQGQLLWRVDITALSTDTELQYVGFASTATANAFIFAYPTMFTSGAPAYSRDCKITVVGDSISVGAYNPNSWPSILKQLLPAATVEINNIAISGSSSVSWTAGSPASLIETADLSDSDFVIVMLGTNDAQGSVSAATFSTNMQFIIDEIISQGSTPILCTPPIFNDSVSYTAHLIPRYVQLVIQLCKTNNISFADTWQYGGDNLDELWDNIHPTPLASRALATAIADAVRPVRTEVLLDKPTVIKMGITYAGTWVAYGSATYRDLELIKHKDHMQLIGMAKSGTIPGTLCNIPFQFAPKSGSGIFTQQLSWSGAAYDFQTVLTIVSNGTVTAQDGSNTWFAIDTTWPIEH